MSSRPSIDTIGAWVTRDQEAFRLQNEWLDELQQTPADQLNKSYRNVLQQWDRSVVKECNRHLSAMEDIPEPNIEERKLMQELNKLVNLGDHMIDRAIAVQAELEAKLGAVDLSDAPSPAQKVAKEEVMEVKETAPVRVPKKTTSAPAPPVKAPRIIPLPASAASVPEASPSTKKPATQEPTAVEKSSDTVDPADPYNLLGVPRDAPLAVIKKAIRKQTILHHPDKIPGDPNASSKFADFTAKCQIFESEESRAQFDATGLVDQVKDVRF